MFGWQSNSGDVGGNLAKVNFPEPPVRRGLGDADAEGAACLPLLSTRACQDFVLGA